LFKINIKIKLNRKLWLHLLKKGSYSEDMFFLWTLYMLYYMIEEPLGGSH